ncbi:hypothetical protein TNCV_1702721 [Trichonephila clavipes]|nr:hypothetical protein TNCV_1702721 [Trichonephila clavipes]
MWYQCGDRSCLVASLERSFLLHRGIKSLGAILYDRRSLLFREQDTVTTQQYLEDELWPVIYSPLSTIGVPNVLHQKDNSKSSTTHINQRPLQDILMLS